MSSYQTFFKNEHFIAVNKPALMLTVPSRFKTEDQRLVLGELIQKELGQTIYPIHRLDFEVSGLVLFALTKPAQKAGNRWFEIKQISKCYEALTELKDKNTPKERLIWKNKLVRGKKRSFEAPHGDLAITHADFQGTKTIEDKSFGLWHLYPITGKPHQLRFHMALHEMPIVGDKLYGATINWEQEGIALNSFLLNFENCPGHRDFGLPLKMSIPSLF